MTMFDHQHYCKLCNDQGDGFQTCDVFMYCHCREPGIAKYPKVGHEIIDTIERMKNGTYNAIEAPVSL